MMKSCTKPTNISDKKKSSLFSELWIELGDDIQTSKKNY